MTVDLLKKKIKFKTIEIYGIRHLKKYFIK